MSWPTGFAVAHLTWSAGIRRTEYVLHGEHGSISVRDDDAELALLGPRLPGGNGAATWQFERETVASAWMDASHVGWFGSLFRQFLHTIDRRDWAGRELQQAVACVRIIETVYASHARG